MSENSPQTDQFENVLSSDVTIVGSLKFAKDLVVDGTIEGEIISNGNLTVGDNARIKGEIKTQSVIVYGIVEGNITATNRCVLKVSASLEGDVVAGTLSIEEGASFSGRSTVGAKAQNPNRPVPAPKKSGEEDQDSAKSEKDPQK